MTAATADPVSPATPPPLAPRRIFAVSVLGALVGFLVALSFGYADHAPRPHGVRLAVVASAGRTRQLVAALDRAVPGGFVLVRVDTAAAARSAVRGQRVAGGFVLASSAAGLAPTATVITAGATGVSQQAAITAALTAAAGRAGASIHALDVAPLSHEDSAGLSGFVLELCLLIPSVIGSVGFFLVGVRHRVWWRAAAAVVFSVLIGAAGVLALDVIYGALTGATLALFGVAVFGALAFALTIGAVQALFGLPGTALAALILVFAGNAMTGAAVSIAFLPNVYRQVAPWLPNNAIVRAARDVTYFHGHEMGHAMLVLALWTGAAIAVLVAVDALHLAARRRQSPPGHPVTAVALMRRRSDLAASDA